MDWKEQIKSTIDREIAISESELTCNALSNESNTWTRLQVKNRLEVKQTILLKEILYNINIISIRRELDEISLVGIEE